MDLLDLIGNLIPPAATAAPEISISGVSGLPKPESISAFALLLGDSGQSGSLLSEASQRPDFPQLQIAFDIPAEKTASQPIPDDEAAVFYSPIPSSEPRVSGLRPTDDEFMHLMSDAPPHHVRKEPNQTVHPLRPPTASVPTDGVVELPFTVHQEQLSGPDPKLSKPSLEPVLPSVPLFRGTKAIEAASGKVTPEPSPTLPRLGGSYAAPDSKILPAVQNIAAKATSDPKTLPQKAILPVEPKPDQLVRHSGRAPTEPAQASRSNTLAYDGAKSLETAPKIKQGPVNENPQVNATGEGGRNRNETAVPDQPKTMIRLTAPELRSEVPPIDRPMQTVRPEIQPRSQATEPPISNSTLAPAMSTETNAPRHSFDEVGQKPELAVLSATPNWETAPSSKQPTHSLRFDPATPIARQISMAVSVVQTEGTIDVALEPADLGKIRMTFSQGEGAMVLSVSAERHDTMDLLRRHTQILESELEAMGLNEAEISFSFGQAPQDTPTQRPLKADHAETQLQHDPEFPKLPNQATTEGRLNLRL